MNHLFFHKIMCCFRLLTGVCFYHSWFPSQIFNAKSLFEEQQKRGSERGQERKEGGREESTNESKPPPKKLLFFSFLHIAMLSMVTSLVAQMVKRLSAMWETWVQSLCWEVPWRRKWQPTPVLLPRKSHGRRSLVSMGLQRVGHDSATEQLHFHYAFRTQILQVEFMEEE